MTMPSAQTQPKLPPYDQPSLLGKAVADYYRHQLRCMVRMDGSYSNWSAATAAGLHAFYRIEDVSVTVFCGWLERVFAREYGETSIEFARRYAASRRTQAANGKTG